MDELPSQTEVTKYPMKPLFKWAGGKTRLISQYEERIGLPTDFEVFSEPFVGAGAMTCHIRNTMPQVKKFRINDVSHELMLVYQTLKSHPDAMLKQLAELEAEYLPLDFQAREKFYYSLRDKYIFHYRELTQVEEASTLLFMLRTSFNGIWRVYKFANGRFSTARGTLIEKSVFDHDNLLEWAAFLQDCEVTCGDWKSMTDTTEPNSFHFFDPPYRNTDVVYSTPFGDNEQLELIEACNAVHQSSSVFYCNIDAGDGFYDLNKGNLQAEVFSHKYSTRLVNRTEIKELLLYKKAK